MKAALLIALLPSLAVAQGFGFSEGVHAVDLGGEGRRFEARACGVCHVEIAAQWRSSRHAQALTNPTFQRGFSVEPAARCVRCHAPMPDQIREVLKALPVGSVHSRRGAAAISALQGPRASEGVGCASCHVREAAVQTVHAVSTKAHPSKQTTALKDPAFCAGCHEFRFEQTAGGKRTLSENATQTTYSEWKRYRDAGGAQTCQGCHFPGGDHRAHGAHDSKTLAASLQVTQEGTALLLSSVGVGHELPTGDIFRHLTVEVLRAGRFETVATLGRTFTPDARLVPLLTANTSLVPGESRRVELGGATVPWRVRYHFVREVEDEASLPADARPVTLARSEPFGRR